MFRMKATNVVGDSEWSAYMGPLYPGVAPTRPGAITFTATSRTSISFGFAEVIGQDTGGTDLAPIPVQYHIYKRSVSEDSDFTLLQTADGGDSIEARYLVPGHKYEFKYQALNSFGLLSPNSSAYWMFAGSTPSALAKAPQMISQSDEVIHFTLVDPADTGGTAVTRFEV